MSELTREQIELSISAAYDSLGIVNELKDKEPLSPEEAEDLKRNKEHISIMLGKEWFYSALTEEQKNELEAAIA